MKTATELWTYNNNNKKSTNDCGYFKSVIIIITSCRDQYSYYFS